jgi:hypothetical protein
MSTLKPGETCLFCGHVGETPAPKVKREPKKKPTCHRCDQGFTHATPWRIFRGKRVHIACLDKPLSA